MKLIASSKPGLSMIERELKGNEPGIALLPEGIWDGGTSIPDEVLQLTLDYRVTIIGTRKTELGFDVVYFVRDGIAVPAGVYLKDNMSYRYLNAYRLFHALNTVHDVSPCGEPVTAIIKQCSEVFTNPPQSVNGVDLICVPSSIDHTRYESVRNLLFKANRKSIS